MNRTVFLTATSLIVLFGSAASYATGMSPPTQEQRVDNRQARQSGRIDQGIASGEVTRREQHRLQHQQSHIQRLESSVEADGTVTRKEAFRVEKAQDHASRSIARQKHDRQNPP